MPIITGTDRQVMEGLRSNSEQLENTQAADVTPQFVDGQQKTQAMLDEIIYQLRNEGNLQLLQENYLLAAQKYSEALKLGVENNTSIQRTQNAILTLLKTLKSNSIHDKKKKERDAVAKELVLVYQYLNEETQQTLDTLCSDDNALRSQKELVRTLSSERERGLHKFPKQEDKKDHTQVSYFKLES